MKKDEFTATCTLCNKDINVKYIGFGALKQCAEKQKHKGFAYHLSNMEEETETTKRIEIKAESYACIFHEEE